MNRKNYQMVWSSAFALLCALLPALAIGQANDPFIENLRVRNEVTSKAIEQGPLGGIVSLLRGDHLQGSDQRGAGPLFGGNQRRQVQSENWRPTPASAATGLSLRNPLEGKLGWGKPAPQVVRQQQSQRPAPQVVRQQQYQQPAPRQQYRQPAPQREFRQPAMASAPKEGALNRLFAGLKQKRDSEPAAAAQRTIAPERTKERGPGVLAFLRKDKAPSNDYEGDWSREAERRASARTATPQVAQVAQLASVNPETAVDRGVLGRLVKKKPVNSWMGIPKEEPTPAPAPAPAKTRATQQQPSADQMTTREQRFVKSDRTGFHAAGKKLTANRPDFFLNKGTTVNVTNDGWNWSNVVLS
ncbi:MAG: hypothetical protein O3C21_14900, partial [Verrucomicrobia bacterium]|nr:hypothetical protein [Verrucomicrobiota bacterium]